MSVTLIRSFGRTVTVIRSGPSEYVEGYARPGDTKCEEIIAAVQPLNSREMMFLPEGDRYKEWKKLYSVFDFKTQRTLNGKIVHQDVIVIDGRRFSVDKVTNYTDPFCMDITYYRADCSLENENTNDHPAEV